MKMVNTSATAVRRRGQQFVIFESFLRLDEERSIVNEVLERHRQCSSSGGNDLMIDPKRTNSLKLELGIACGEDLSPFLRVSADIARRAFNEASALLPLAPPLVSLADSETPLTGLSLLYGPCSAMSPHYDSPTQPGKREEWLCMLTIGLTCVFRLDDQTVELNSGDALVMDSMSVLHGVDGISAASSNDVCSSIGLPTDCRLGLLFWQGRAHNTEPTDTSHVPSFEGLANMYGDVEDES